MQIQPAVWQETRRIALGTGILSVLMVAVFLIIGRFDHTVILGALVGNIMAVGNFFLLALSVQRAAERMNGVKLPPLPEKQEGEEEGEQPEPPLSPEAKMASQKMRISYTLRLLGIGVAAVIVIKIPVFNSVAALLPLLFPRLVIFILSFIQSNKKEA